MTEMQLVFPPLKILLLPLFILIPLYIAAQALVIMKIIQKQFEITAAINIIHIELQKLDPDFPQWMQKVADEAKNDLDKI